MPIVSSQSIADSHQQAGGGRYVHERHTDQAGKVHTIGPYLAADGFDVAARLQSRALELSAHFADIEAARNIGGLAVLLAHQTAAQFAARFWSRVRDAFRDGDKTEFARLIWWLYNRITGGQFTSDQARLSFNAAYGRSLNTAQWNSLVTTRLVPVRDRYQATLDEADL